MKGIAKWGHENYLVCLENYQLSGVKPQNKGQGRVAKKEQEIGTGGTLMS